MKRNILKTLMCVGFLASFASFAVAYPMTAALNSIQVVPANSSVGHGVCKINGTDIGWMVTFDVTCEFTGLSGGVVDADLRQSAAGLNQDPNEVFDCWDKRATVTLPNNGSGILTLACSWDNWFGPYPSLTSKKYYIVLKTLNYPDGEIRGQIKPTTLDNDSNGEGRSEISIFRPSEKTAWTYCGMRGAAMDERLNWNQATDSAPFLADFDGDGIADWSFVRTEPQSLKLSTIYRRSSNNEAAQVQFGNGSFGDITAIGDYNGDGRIDKAVFRPTNGIWYILDSELLFSPYQNSIRYEQWGMAGDTPCPGDYDGDGKTDLCVIRPENEQYAWYIRKSSDMAYERIAWGLVTDAIYVTNPVDVDGDGRNDLLVSRVQNDQRVFYALRSSNRSLQALQWGYPSDMVKLGDYDGDGRTDFAAIRTENDHLIWYIHASSDGLMRSFQWGLPGDM